MRVKVISAWRGGEKRGYCLSFTISGQTKTLWREPQCRYDIRISGPNKDWCREWASIALDRLEQYGIPRRNVKFVHV